MATYVNDLRLKEIGTGESSGTWGSETNTNLELIGEALGFGTEAITTNADTHTTTVADGSTDPGRAMYIKYTGTLDSACTITIAPNTMSRMHFIENGTSGSQNIIISQGTGANVTIPAGDVKAVYLDGAGSGAAVTDAFASLNVVDLKVEDDLTVTDDASIGGDLTVTGSIAGTLSTAAQTNITSLGTLTTLTVDDITINGSTISDAGDLTLDVGGDLTIDVDGADILLKHDGTHWGSIFTNATPNNFFIQNMISDGDIYLSGSDGGSNINALILDMSDAGAATFNGAVTADAGVSIDNITIDGTEIDLSSGDLTIDVAGDIILDAGGGDILFKDDGTLVGTIGGFSSSDVVIKSEVSNKDLIFKGNDGGSEITALTLDMSDAGAATFNSSITVANTISISSSNASAFIQASDNVFQFGTSSDDPMLFFANNNERMRITAAGELLINDSARRGTAWRGQIQVTQIDSTNAAGISCISGNDEIAGTFALYSSSTASAAISVDPDAARGSSALFFLIDNVQKAALDASGNFSITGSYSSSDRTKKENIVTLPSQLETVKKLNPVSFDWKEKAEDGSTKSSIGFIAQEIETLYPDLVYTPEADPDMPSKDTTKHLNYAVITAILTKAIQEQQTQIDALQSEINLLKGE